MIELLRSTVGFPYKVMAFLALIYGIIFGRQLAIRIRAESLQRIDIESSGLPDMFFFLPYTFYGRAKKLMDPVNIVYVGLDSQEFAKKIMSQTAGWQRSYRSCQFVHAQARSRISSVQIIKNIPDQFGRSGLRYHVRLFSFFSARGVPVTLGAAHYEHRENGHQIISWDDARKEVIRDLGLVPNTCEYITEVSKPNWRGHPSDGRTVLLGATLLEPIEVRIE